MTTYQYGRTPSIKDKTVIAQVADITADLSDITSDINTLEASLGDYTAYDDIGSASDAITMDGSVGFYQRVNLTGANAHTLNLTNFTKVGTYGLIVTQSGSGTFVTGGTVTNSGGISAYSIITNAGTANFTSPLTLAAGKHQFVINLTVSGISIGYVGVVA